MKLSYSDFFTKIDTRTLKYTVEVFDAENILVRAIDEGFMIESIISAAVDITDFNTNRASAAYLTAS